VKIHRMLPSAAIRWYSAAAVMAAAVSDISSPPQKHYGFSQDIYLPAAGRPECFPLLSQLVFGECVRLTHVTGRCSVTSWSCRLTSPVPRPLSPFPGGLLTGRWAATKPRHHHQRAADPTAHGNSSGIVGPSSVCCCSRGARRYGNYEVIGEGQRQRQAHQPQFRGFGQPGV
jgi:hypothetical protein